MKHFQNINDKLSRIENYLHNQALDIIGIEAIKHFQDSFTNEGFTDTNIVKWDNVKRKDSASPWYGFKYGGTGARPGVKRRKQNSITNNSDAATQRPILSGETQELINAFEYEKKGTSVTIYNTKPYAQIHNEGGTMKVFNKRTAKMPQRQFMGRSAVLRAHLRKEIMSDILKILK